MERKEPIFSSNEIRVVMKYLWAKGMKTSDIVKEINEIVGEGCLSKSVAYRWIEKFQGGNYSVEDEVRTGRPPRSDLKQGINALLQIDPYQSARSLASQLSVDKNTVIRVLEKEMDMRLINFKWIPKELTSSQKLKRMECARCLLHNLNTVRYHSLILTGDETFLYWKTQRKRAWIKSGDPPPTRERKSIGSKKVMITVIWSTSGMKSITMLERGAAFTKDHFINVVLKDLLETITIERPVKKCSELKIHLDNARPHLVDDFLTNNGLERLSHPHYSPIWLLATFSFLDI